MQLGAGGPHLQEPGGARLLPQPRTLEDVLRNLVVVETAVGVAAPLVSRVLADFGATVIKVESAAQPDFIRTRIVPPGMSAEEADDVWPQIHNLCSGKASVTLNLKTDKGKELFLQILEQADVYIENFVPGWLERLGLSLEELARRSPRLVILSQAAYGGDGPLSQQRAYAPVMTALAGLESLVGYADGRVTSQTAMATGDMVAAYYGLLFVLSALYERERTGHGAIVDQSQTECSVTLIGVALAEFGLTGVVPGPEGNGSPVHPVHGIYPTAGDDRWVALAAWDEDDRAALLTALDISDPSLVASRTALEERDALVERLQSAGVACTPVLASDELEHRPELVERGLWQGVRGSRGQEVRIARTPWLFDGLHLEPRPAEAFGAGTDRVLRDLVGAAENALRRWHDEGVLT